MFSLNHLIFDLSTFVKLTDGEFGGALFDTETFNFIADVIGGRLSFGGFKVKFGF
jgi:hypothetical protein